MEALSVARDCIQRKVRPRLIQFAAALILTFCLWGHVSELFDHWDSTAKTGNDIEYSTVIVVLTVGVGITLARVAIAVFLRLPRSYYFAPFVTASFLGAPIPGFFIGHSPPQTLRI